MDLYPTNIAHAPARSTAESSPSLERGIGQLVAGAASLVAEALREYQNGGLTTATKRQGGDCIAHLYRLRQFMIGTWDFDAMAREHGRAVLLEASGSEVSPATVDELVTAVLEILAKVVRAAVN